MSIGLAVFILVLWELTARIKYNHVHEFIVTTGELTRRLHDAGRSRE